MMSVFHLGHSKLNGNTKMCARIFPQLTNSVSWENEFKVDADAQ